MRKSRCRVCHDKCLELAKLYDSALGYVCPSCFSFLLYAEKELRGHGIEGVKYQKEGETP